MLKTFKDNQDKTTDKTNQSPLSFFLAENSINKKLRLTAKKFVLWYLNLEAINLEQMKIFHLNLE